MAGSRKERPSDTLWPLKRLLSMMPRQQLCYEEKLGSHKGEGTTDMTRRCLIVAIDNVAIIIQPTSSSTSQPIPVLLFVDSASIAPVHLYITMSKSGCSFLFPLLLPQYSRLMLNSECASLSLLNDLKCIHKRH